MLQRANISIKNLLENNLKIKIKFSKYDEYFDINFPKFDAIGLGNGDTNFALITMVLDLLVITKIQHQKHLIFY